MRMLSPFGSARGKRVNLDAVRSFSVCVRKLTHRAAACPQSAERPRSRDVMSTWKLKSRASGALSGPLAGLPVAQCASL
jgi:hypothetical protein